jgi:hypothetical protein
MTRTRNDIARQPEGAPAAPEAETDRIGDMSPRDFAQLGMNHIAYIRAVPTDDDGTGWAIHAANGQQIGMAPTHDLAFAATRQHDMEPLSVH